MPTYSYRCRTCGDEFDIQQSFSDDPLAVCEACGGELRKLFNSVGVVFKGSGFYRNDARGSSPSLTAKKTDPAPAPKTDVPGPVTAAPPAAS
ncbi:FmdB family zinc ribbon protein [Flaviflexus huanghaiensis]|uniref:FmdB family zinc ribbon protein n=1 Tax=Flaviflexus huanghaiensis TaxID=1111473 RepID=UPI0015F93291